MRKYNDLSNAELLRLVERGDLISRLCDLDQDQPPDHLKEWDSVPPVTLPKGELVATEILACKDDLRDISNGLDQTISHPVQSAFGRLQKRLSGILKLLP